ncbi:30S ribosomal protein S21 [Candidatus Poribacteria bacterium]|nr:30S ribosomal protein S21 [Candidatus Poribacteria bacterium]
MVTEVRVKKNEPIEKAIRRFKKRCDKDNLVKEIKKRQHYIKPSERRRKRRIKNKKRSRD